MRCNGPRQRNERHRVPTLEFDCDCSERKGFSRATAESKAHEISLAVQASPNIFEAVKRSSLHLIPQVERGRSTVKKGAGTYRRGVSRCRVRIGARRNGLLCFTVDRTEKTCETAVRWTTAKGSKGQHHDEYQACTLSIGSGRRSGHGRSSSCRSADTSRVAGSEA
jgi:hypothetical protein